MRRRGPSLEWLLRRLREAGSGKAPGGALRSDEAAVEARRDAREALAEFPNITFRAVVTRPWAHTPLPW